MIFVTRVITGPIETNTYLVANEEAKCLIIDPASGCGEILQKIKSDSLTVEAIVLTHSHFDHITGIPEILSSLAADLPIYIHPAEEKFLADPQLNGSMWFGQPFFFRGSVLPLNEGNQRIGSFMVEVLHVPGHTPGGIALVLENYCFSGDALFAGSIGRSDLPGGDGDALVAGIKARLLVLPDATIVCSGHGGRTTIGREKRCNPFL